jgi:hypothetical protein
MEKNLEGIHQLDLVASIGVTMMIPLSFFPLIKENYIQIFMEKVLWTLFIIWVLAFWETVLKSLIIF